MPTPYSELPDPCRIRVDEGLGRELLGGCAAVPPYSAEELYGTALQTEIREAVRHGAPARFDDLIKRIRQRLDVAPFSVVVRGIPFHLDERLFIAVCRALGELIAPPLQKPRAQLVHRIQPSTDLKSSKGTHRETERLHTDCADWPEPSRLLAMTCVRPDPWGGGDSLVLDMVELADELEKSAGPEAVEALRSEAVPWKLAPYLGGEVVWQPVLDLDHRRLRWRRYTIDAALESEGVRIGPDLLELLDRVEKVVEGTARTLRFRLDQGDLLIMDNHRAIHGRTALGDETRPSDRLMLRSWIRPELDGGSDQASPSC